MNKTTEALHKALKVLNCLNNRVYETVWVKGAINACKEALAELALEQMAQNAREFGLVYCKHGSDRYCKECAMEEAK